MENFSTIETTILNLQIGCVLRWERLKKELSQFDLATNLGTNPTQIGRIERSANVSGWDKIYIVSLELNVEFTSLFILKEQESLLKIVEESILLEKKLTTPKRRFYEKLKLEIVRLYEILKASDS